MPEEIDETKYHKLSPKQKTVLWVVLGLVVFVGLPIMIFAYYKFAVLRPSQIVDELTYEVKNGMAVSEISDELYDLGVLNSKSLFNFYVYWNKIDKDIQAGVYTIPAGVSIVELSDILQHGVNDTKIRFVEGWRVEEYAREASLKFPHIDYNDFLDIAKSHEGYLFPDTYMFNSGVQEGDILKVLIDTFDKKTKDVLTQQNLQSAGLTLEEAVIFASIVEREVPAEEDRPIVAGILIKRWREDMPIGADATTQYAVAVDKYCVPASCRDIDIECTLADEVSVCLEELSKNDAMEIEWWPKEITFYDLNFDSPYNTRKNIGLPPKPISNPGLSAMEAVLNYKDTPYYYYLHDIEGTTYYSVDLEGHQNNISRYLND